MPLGNREIGFYDDNYFDSVSQANRSLSYIQEVSDLLKILKINNNSKIIDLGCGTAEISYYIMKVTNSEVVGVDFDDFRKNYLKNIIPFRKGTSDSIPFEDNSLDAVLCIHSIAHFDKIEESLNEIYRILKKGGILGIITPNKLFNYCYLIPNKLEIIKYTKDKTVNYRLSFRDMKNLINESKFNFYKIRHVGELPEFLNYKIIPKNINYINIQKRIIAKLVKI